MSLQVKSRREATEALAYFNDFHDGFVESIGVKVTPESPLGFEFAAPVRYDVTVTLVHSNYEAAAGNGECPQRVELRLVRVREMNLGNMIAFDNMLQECLIDVDADGFISLDVGGDGMVTFVCAELTIEELRRGEPPGPVFAPTGRN